MFKKKDEAEKGVPAQKVKYTWQQNVALYLNDFIFISVILCAVLMLFLRVSIVKGSSMENTLLDGDYMLLVSNLFYQEPKSGDIVVVSKQAYDDGKPLVKRVIATEGQTVDIDFDAGIVYVDGVALDEPYTKTLTTRPEGNTFPQVVEEGKVFVMGDNRNNSRDSRYTQIGQVDKREVLGKVMFLLFPGTGEDGTQERDFSRVGALE